MTVPPETYPIEVVLEYAPADDSLRVDDLTAAIRQVMADHHVAPGTGVTLVLTSDEQVQAFNLAYRGVDAPTDILSFAAGPLPGEILGDVGFELDDEDEAILDAVWAEIAEEDRQAELGNVSPDDDDDEFDAEEDDPDNWEDEDGEEVHELPYLGDLIVAYPYTARHAAEAGHALADEFTLLVVHGTLHLLGYDHDTAENQDRMWAKQAELLAALGVTGITVEYFNFGDEADA